MAAQALGIPDAFLEEIDMNHRLRLEDENRARTLRKQLKGSAMLSAAWDASKTLRSFREMSILDDASQMPLVSVAHSYEPCVAELETLRAMSILDLKLEKNHRGRLLLVRLVGAATQTWARLLAAVEDESGSTCVLSFTHHRREISADEFMPAGAVLAIKEPYLHLDAAYSLAQTHVVLRIDHPANLMVLPPTSDLIPLQLRTESQVIGADCWKERGNLAFRNKRFLEAQRCYTEGINIAVDSNDKSLQATLYRNRAQAYLSQYFFVDAKSDALQSLPLLTADNLDSKIMNAKALFKAARASYHLGQFEESHALLAQHEKLIPGDQAASALGKKIKSRLREQIHGTYDLSKMRQRLQPSGKADVASCFAKVELRPSPGPDRGSRLFAVSDMRAGDVVLCEKAFVVTASEDAQSKKADLINYDPSTPILRAK